MPLVQTLKQNYVGPKIRLSSSTRPGMSASTDLWEHGESNRPEPPGPSNMQ